MPSKLKRYQTLGHHHFVRFSCEGRLPYLQSDVAKDLFLKELEAIRKLYDFQIVAYVTMPEHVHLLVSEPRLALLGTAIGVLKRNVSRKFRQKPFWLVRYYDFNVSSNEKLFEKITYIHQNPVLRKLVARPEEYKWSSFRNYARLEEGPVEVTRAV